MFHVEHFGGNMNKPEKMPDPEPDYDPDIPY